MLSRDLIATVVKTFFEELSDVRNGGKADGQESPYTAFYSSYFSREREWFLKASVQDITMFLADDPIQKLEMLAELMFRDSRSLTDTELQGMMYRKIMGLYDVIDVRSMEFSMERMNRMALLKELAGEN